MPINSCLLSSTCLKNKNNQQFTMQAWVVYLLPLFFPLFFLTITKDIVYWKVDCRSEYWTAQNFVGAMLLGRSHIHFSWGNITLTDTFLFIPTGFKFKFQNSSLSQSNLFIATAYFHAMHMLVSISKILV